MRASRCRLGATEANSQSPLGAPKKGLRIAWGGDWNGAFPCEDGVLAVCERR